MTEDVFRKLDAMFDDRERQVQERRAASAQAKERDDQKMESFQKVVNDTIRPAMQEMGEYLETRGHKFEIWPNAKRAEQHISFTIVPEFYDSGRDDYQMPMIRFRLAHISSKVTIERVASVSRKGTLCAKEAEVALQEVDTELVRQKIADLISNVFS
ncbi:hypothetical protein [Agrobacterium tumefaciens]|uniref:hypothetical protein n=1 Tax=Agrobacterium tumefaciens TaxID=358 RepID=UPI000976915A|nr:hypothetical protein BV900_02470 [Agrobacterium tumefaciens]